MALTFICRSSIYPHNCVISFFFCINAEMDSPNLYLCFTIKCLKLSIFSLFSLRFPSKGLIQNHYSASWLRLGSSVKRWQPFLAAHMMYLWRGGMPSWRIWLQPLSMRFTLSLPNTAKRQQRLSTHKSISLFIFGFQSWSTRSFNFEYTCPISVTKFPVIYINPKQHFVINLLLLLQFSFYFPQSQLLFSVTILPWLVSIFPSLLCKRFSEPDSPWPPSCFCSFCPTVLGENCLWEQIFGEKQMQKCWPRKESMTELVEIQDFFARKPGRSQCCGKEGSKAEEVRVSSRLTTAQHRINLALLTSLQALLLVILQKSVKHHLEILPFAERRFLVDQWPQFVIKLRISKKRVGF